MNLPELSDVFLVLKFNLQFSPFPINYLAADTCPSPPLIRLSKVVPDHVTSDQGCQMKCILSRVCDSFNLGPQTSSKHYPCEILDRRISRKKTKRKEWKFRGGKVNSSFLIKGIFLSLFSKKKNSNGNSYRVQNVHGTVSRDTFSHKRSLKVLQC